MKKRKMLALDLSLVAALFFAGFKMTSGLGEYQDLSFVDEQGYISRGSAWLLHGTPLAPEWGPLYSVWYAGLIKTVGTVSAFYLNTRLLVALVPVAAFSVARVFVAPVPSALAALFLLTNQSLLMQWPKVGVFAYLVFLLAVAAAIRLRTPLACHAVAGMGIVLATYARPEFAMALLPWFGLAFFASGLRWNAAWLLLIPLFAAVVVGDPFSGGRGWIAFGQYFSAHYIEWNGLKQDAWLEWSSVMEKAMPHAHNVFEAFWKYPRLTLRHLVTNVGQLPVALLRSCATHWPFFLPSTLPRASTLESVTFGIWIAWAMRSQSQWHERARAFWAEHRNRLGIILLPVLPAIAGAVVTGPLPRHLLWAPILFCLGLAWLLSHLFQWRRLGHATVLVPLAIVALAPTVGSRWTTPYTPLAPNRDYVAALARLPLKVQKRPFKIAASLSGYHAFLKTAFVPCPPSVQPVDRLAMSCGADIVIFPENEIENRPLPKDYVSRYTPRRRRFWVKAAILSSPDQP